MKHALIYTDGGATRDEEVGYYSGWGMWGKAENSEDEVLIYAACPHGDSNNRAEMRAYIRALKWIMEEEFTSAHLILDSKYVLDHKDHVLQSWKANGWFTSKGLAVKNKDLWMAIDTYQEMCRDKNITLTDDWVKGHSDVYGNEQADDGATMGTALARNSDFEERKINPKTKAAIEAAEKEKRKKTKAQDPFALVCGRRIFEMINAERITIAGLRAYMTTSFDDTDPIKGRGLGVMAGERFEGLVVPSEPIAALDDIIDYQEEILTDATIRPVLFYWDKIKSAQTWKQIALDGRGCFLKKRNDLVFHDGATPISQYLDPPRQARRCAEQMAKRKEIIESLIKDPDTYKRIDVTNLFFEENKKGKLTIREDIAKVKAVQHNWDVDGRVAKIIMSFDYEIPNRNALAKALKQGKDIKCELIITEQTENTFRWHLYVETPVGYGLFDNPATNLYILPH